LLCHITRWPALADYLARKSGLATNQGKQYMHYQILGNAKLDVCVESLEGSINSDKTGVRD
jgi:hypothetical protein